MNPDGFRITVVVPTRDRTAPLRRALESIRAQTRPPDEVIVVDDGSADGSAFLLDGGFPDVRLIRQGRRGVSAARNRGVREAAGAWIAFLDSDDAWLPRKLERQVAALRGRPEHSLCHTDEIWIRNGRRVNPKEKHAKAGGRIFRRCLPLCAISPSSVLARRSLLDEVGGFDETLPVCEDYDLWLRICSKEPVLFVDERLVVKYGGHPDQLSRRYWGMDRFRVRALEKILDSADLEPADRSAALDTLIEKLEIYRNGSRRRNKLDEVRATEAKLRRYLGDRAGLAASSRGARVP